MSRKRFWKIWCAGDPRTLTKYSEFDGGELYAETFQDACDIYFLSSGYGNGRSLYNSEKLTYCGSKLFDNKEDAYKEFLRIWEELNKEDE